MSEFVGDVQSQFKKTSGDLSLFLLKFISGLTLGLTCALVVQEILAKPENETLLAFTLVIVVVTGLFLRAAKSWGLAATLIFDLIAVLIGMVLRLYVMVAPGL